MMAHRSTGYLLGIGALAAASGVALYAQEPHIRPGGLHALLLLGGLAIVAELLAFALPHASRGSIAFIPYLATVVIVPGWPAVATVTVVKTLVESFRRTEPRGAFFNVFQHALTTSIAVWTYALLGGDSFSAAANVSLLGTSAAFGIAALLAFASSFLTNALIVCGYLAIRDSRSFWPLWSEMMGPTIAMDLVAGPVVFIFAWVCAAHGPIAGAALWVPILGLREVHRANLELRQTNQELLQLMVKSIEARDPYTSGHSRRVEHYSTIIARALGLNGKAVERVRRAALLHDVGKIYEKYAPILRKRDKLTPEEWVTMKEHPVDGASLVATMSGLKELVPAVRHHHENWDGTGYPDGLAGENIPIESRIIAFADTIDAMTTERPYRAPLSEAQVRSEIVRQRGRQFDPALADRLLASAVWHQVFFPERADDGAAQAFSIIPGDRARGTPRAVAKVR